MLINYIHQYPLWPVSPLLDESGTINPYDMQLNNTPLRI